MAVTERAIEPEFLSLMPATVSIRRRTGKDDSGNATYDPNVQSWRCRIESNTRRASGVTTAGAVVQASVVETVLIGPYFEPTLKPGDRLTLPTGAQVTWGETQQIEVAWDETGPHHTTLRIAS